MSVQVQSNSQETGNPAGIFICHRRGDVEDLAVLLKDRLERDFPDDNVFLDIESNSIDLAEDFKEEVRDAIRQCHVMLLLIGPNWLEELSRHAGNDNDWLRVEIETALAVGLHISPILVKGASHPTADQLEAFGELATSLPYLNSLSLGAGQDFDPDYARIAMAIDMEAAHARSPPRALFYFLAAGMLLSLSIIAYFWYVDRSSGDKSVTIVPSMEARPSERNSKGALHNCPDLTTWTVDNWNQIPAVIKRDTA